MDIQFTDAKTHLRADLCGDWLLSDVLEAIQRIRDQADQSGHKRLLVDWRNVGPPDSEFERFQVGETVAVLLRPPFRVAAVCDKKVINKFAENTAVNRGAIFLVCDQFDEAMQFLNQTSDGARSGGPDVSTSALPGPELP
jgi:hypothetical protein